MVKRLAYTAGDPDSVPGLGRLPGEGNGNPLQYSCLENPMDTGVWWATVYGVAKSRTRLSSFTFTFSPNYKFPKDSCLENPMDGGVWWATVYGVYSTVGLQESDMTEQLDHNRTL